MVFNCITGPQAPVPLKSGPARNCIEVVVGVAQNGWMSDFIALGAGLTRSKSVLRRGTAPEGPSKYLPGRCHITYDGMNRHWHASHGGWKTNTYTWSRPLTWIVKNGLEQVDGKPICIRLPSTTMEAAFGPPWWETNMYSWSRSRPPF